MKTLKKIGWFALALSFLMVYSFYSSVGVAAMKLGAPDYVLSRHMCLISRIFTFDTYKLV